MAKLYLILQCVKLYQDSCLFGYSEFILLQYTVYMLNIDLCTGVLFKQ